MTDSIKQCGWRTLRGVCEGCGFCLPSLQKALLRPRSKKPFEKMCIELSRDKLRVGQNALVQGYRRLAYGVRRFSWPMLPPRPRDPQAYRTQLHPLLASAESNINNIQARSEERRVGEERRSRMRLR